MNRTKNAFPRRAAALALLLLPIAAPLFAAEPVDFSCKPMLAGRAALAGEGFYDIRTVGVANFSPELRFPVQLVYRSASDRTGLAGFAWSLPQLESRVAWDKDGMLWTAPWGEEIKFFEKQKQKPGKDALDVPFLDAENAGRGFYAPYSEWEAVPAGGDPAKSKDWTVSGRRGKKGWRFVYRGGAISRIAAPSGGEVAFERAPDGRLLRAVQLGTAMVELAYAPDGSLDALVASGVTNRFSFAAAPLAILPRTDAGSVVAATRPRLVSVRTGDLDPVEFSYEGNFLSGVRRGPFSESLRVEGAAQTRSFAERLARGESGFRPPPGLNAGRLLSDGSLSYGYDGGALRVADAAGRAATYAFDRKNGVLSLTDEGGRKTTVYYFMRYDVAYMGRVRKIVDAKGRDRAGYRYDPQTGALVRFRDFLGNDHEFEYDAAGNLVRTFRRAADSDKREPLVAYGRDTAGNPVSVSRLDAAGNAVATATARFDPAGRPLALSAGGGRVSIAYNAFGYPVSVRNGFDQTFTAAYDRYNRLVSATDDNGVVTTCELTPAGLVRRLERRDRADRSVLLGSLEIDYDGAGRPVAYRDAAGREKRVERDSFGRVVKEFFPDDASVEYSYDAVGRLRTVLDENRHSIRFDWNRFGLKSETTAVGQVTDYVADDYGLLSRVGGSDPQLSGRPVRREYDEFDRLVGAVYADGEREAFSYDAWGRLASVSRGGRTAAFRYDYFGNLVEKTDGDVVSRYAYDAWGRRTKMSVEGGGLSQKETRAYDDAGRLVSIRTPDDSLFYEYGPHNRVKRQIVNDTQILFAYDKYGRLTGKRMVPLVPEK